LNKLVVACFGDSASLDVIAEQSAAHEVIAVAMDFGGAVSLTDMRDLALAAGARRCHALDVREEFVRDCVLPALRMSVKDRVFADPSEAHAALGPAFAMRKLREIAALEDAAVVEPLRVPHASRAGRVAAVPPRHLDIAFEHGVPVAINGVVMSLVELLESLETITGEAALTVLDRYISSPRDPQFA
jgi:argininosuccinate synthase